MRTPELIATHSNTDFDAFAAMVAAHKLYPEAQISLGGAVNRNVREFQALYADAIPVIDPADVDRQTVRRLILVDTVHANRLGDLGDLCGREDVQVVAFDHHAHPGDLPDYLDPDALVSSSDGSLVTLLVRDHRRARHPGDARSRRPSSPWASTRTPGRSRSRPPPPATPRRWRGACAAAPTPNCSRSG